MPENYEKLLERTITVQEGVALNLDALTANTKEMNDKFVTHNETTNDVRKELIVLKELITKYLKWAILAIIMILGGEQVVQTIIDKV